MTMEQLFCQAICASLYPERFKFPKLSNEEFERICDAFEKHTLELLIYDKIKSDDNLLVPLKKLQTDIYMQKIHYAQYLHTQDEILKKMILAGIPCVILKGTVSSSYYTKPYLRRLGDIDLLIKKKDEDMATRCLVEMGYKHHEYFEDEFEQSYNNGYFQIELHTGFSPEKQFGRHANKINDYLLEGFNDICNIELEGYVFPSFKEDRVGVLMLEHLHRHLLRGVGFRQVIDWMQYVDHYIDDKAWESKMKDLFSYFHLDKFAITVTAMCQKYLGLRTDEMTWMRDADDQVCEELFLYIMSMGNFGINLQANKEGLAKRICERDFFSLLRFTQHTGMNTWNATKKYNWLKPFAWIYQIRLFFVHAKQRNYDISLSSIVEEKKRMKKVQRLMKDLGL